MEDQTSTGQLITFLIASWVCVGATIGLAEEDGNKHCGESAGLLILFFMFRILISPVVYLVGMVAYLAVLPIKLLTVIPRRYGR